MTNLFSSFEPTVFFIFMSLSLKWFSLSICIFLVPQVFWMMSSQLSKSLKTLNSFLSKELLAALPLSIPGTIFFLLNLFSFILASNFIGLFPYVFTASSHLVTTLSLALPMWVGSMTWSVVFQYNSLLAHLVPSGTPGGLMPVMVIIETVSNIIRPATLAIRLGANMVAGHLLLTLLGSQFSGLTLTKFPFLMLGLTLLVTLEIAVACIQAYVFTLLATLYLGEISSISFNKTMIL